MAVLGPLVEPHARERLLAQGLARGIIWRNGSLPPGSPNFPPELTDDLLNFGYGVLAIALQLRETAESTAMEATKTIVEGFRVAAEAIESATRRAAPAQPLRSFHLLVAGAAFHLGGYPARSYTLISRAVDGETLGAAEKTLALLLRHRFDDLRRYIVATLDRPEDLDEQVAARLLDDEDTFDASDVTVAALTRIYQRAVGLVDTALMYGRGSVYQEALARLEQLRNHAGLLGVVPSWWIATLTKHLLIDLWDTSLHQRLPSGGVLPKAWDHIRSRYIELHTADPRPRLALWPSQLEAARRAIDPEDSLVVALPTSAGKTRIAELCILRTLADSRRVVYVTPLRALSAQVERTLARTFVPLGASVTSLYGAAGITSIDRHTLTDAMIVVSTPEKLDFAIRQDPSVLDDVGLVVFDEGHMIGLGSREIRYEVLIQRLLRRTDAASRRIVCLSAMFNPEDDSIVDFAGWLRKDLPGESIHVQWRPTRQLLATLERTSSTSAALNFVEGEKPFVPKFVEARAPVGMRKNAFPQNDIEFCIASANEFAREGDDVLVYSPQRRQIEPLVREFVRIARQGYLEGVKRPAVSELQIALAIGREWLGEDHVAMHALPLGIGTHHGALPRPFLSAVEDLLLRCQLQVVVASPTLAQGIDLACRVLLFRSIHRFNLRAGYPIPIEPAEFSNVVGRAGRAYVDLDGIAVYPIFKMGATGQVQKRDFLNLVARSKTLRLFSGLAQLVIHVAKELQSRVGIIGDTALLEYVANHANLWSDSSVQAQTQVDEDGDEESLNHRLADLDVALFSLIEDLTVSADQLAAALDAVLVGSLWNRTLQRVSESQQQIAKAVIHSRAQWLWNNTTAQQRRTCFSAGLGQRSGVLIDERLDEFAKLLSQLNAAVASSDSDSAGDAAVSFAKLVFTDPFFAPRHEVQDWESTLRGWISGRAFSQVARTQEQHSFVQETVVFRLVWAAEAIRAQIKGVAHSQSEELGDGPAMCLTYGVPNLQAALLCQVGFASRLGAIHGVSKLNATFTEASGVRRWIRDNAELLSSPEFWASADQHLLWITRGPSLGQSAPTLWAERTFKVVVDWREGAIKPAYVRIMAVPGSDALVCTEDLQTVGTCSVGPEVRLDGFTEGRVLTNGDVEIRRFGVI